MLSTAPGIANAASGSSSHSGAGSPTSGGVGDAIKTVKSEPFASLSPENASNHTVSDDTSNVGAPKNGAINNNNNGGNNGNGTGSNVSNSSNEGLTASVSGTPMIRQNSSSSINSCLAASPNNVSDHSNSSSISTNLAQLVEGASVVGTDLLQDEKKKKANIKEEENIGKVAAHSIVSPDKLVTSCSGSGSGTALAGISIKEEPADILGSLVHMKKEENVSPSMSPVGFASITGPPGSIQDGSVTPVKMELNPNTSNNNNHMEKVSSDVVLSNDTLAGGNSLNADAINETATSISGLSVGIGPGQGPGPGHGHINATSSIGTGGAGGGSIGIALNAPTATNNFVGSNGGGPLGNCLDYMQQQNHIFVFSTQLANKAAESVLSGQFQTIIAYHCTQPATKSFLEDFFLKNPMKMNKLQRQNSLGICNMPGSGIGGNAQPWQMASAPGSASNLVSKIMQSHQKPSNSKSQHHFNQTDNNSKANSLRGPAINVPNSFVSGDPSEPLVNESDLMCWDNASIRNSLDNGGGSSGGVVGVPGASGPGSNETQTIKLLDGNVHVDAITTANMGKCSELNNENNIISLQGVKVPDENLTPQQRQHREEQLAKIKKMNQFLFPENDTTTGMTGGTHGNPLNTKLPPNNNDSIAPGMAPNMILNMPVGSNAGAGAIASQMRHMQSNIIAQNTQQKPEHMPSSIADDVLLSGEALIDMGPAMPCNTGGPKGPCGPVNQHNTSPGSLQCGSSVMNVNVGNIVTNSNSMQPGPSNNPTLITHSPEIMGGFGNTNCGSIIGSGANNNELPVKGISVPQVGMAQMEWSKIQQQFFEERLKGGNKSVCRPPGLTTGPPPPMGSGPNTANQTIRTNVQGPPPPYHPTQRSASVPIATQSPNPSSPNNLSLPSPRTAGALGITSNSPSIDSATTTTTNTPTNAAMGSLSASKNCFQTEAGSPSNRHRAISGSTNVINHLNSNPSTPLSHLSPKELEPFNQPSISGELKGTRPSPQRPRSPGSSSNNLIEPSNLMESRYGSSSPGLNFNAHMQSSSNTSINVYKGTIERQNTGASGPTQFTRRTDNMPLNPHSTNNRQPPSKMAQNFDPISSLAQMSQQLTSCVSSVGSPAAGMNMINGPMEINISQSLEHGIMPGIDANSIDHMNHTPIGPGPGHTLGLGPSGNNCHPLMNSMGQRMLNPKICGTNQGFSGGANGVGPGPGSSFHGIMPPATRMMSRMPVNFSPNFNPNIQVKASTPNTIQYMPVRPQNNNNNNNGNVRMPLSLEFLQRYANPQNAAAGGSAIGNDGSIIGSGPMNINSPTEQQNKLPNNLSGGNGNGLNFFPNCNQLPGLDDESSVLPGHELGIGQPPMVRGMRPHGMRQHGLGSSRLQAPIGNIMNRQFPGVADGMDCSEPIFNNSVGAAMFSSSQQQSQQKSQHLKSMPGNICQNSSAIGNVVIPGNNPAGGAGAVMLPGDMGQPVMGPNNSVVGQGNVAGGNNNNQNPQNYKPFVGPTSGDLKYAQQYHSFQQQLYATSTRSQQHQQGGVSMNAMPPNLSPNTAFFGSK